MTQLIKKVQIAPLENFAKIFSVKRESVQKKGGAQELAGALLFAEVKMGELLRDLPTPAGSKIGKRGVEKTLPDGINHNQSSTFQTMAEHPEAIEEVIQEAEDNDEIPTRSAVLKKWRKIFSVKRESVQKGTHFKK